jgi:hypothetical protein
MFNTVPYDDHNEPKVPGYKHNPLNSVLNVKAKTWINLKKP